MMHYDAFLICSVEFLHCSHLGLKASQRLALRSAGARWLVVRLKLASILLLLLIYHGFFSSVVFHSSLFLCIPCSSTCQGLPPNRCDFQPRSSESRLNVCSLQGQLLEDLSPHPSGLFSPDIKLTPPWPPVETVARGCKGSCFYMFVQEDLGCTWMYIGSVEIMEIMEIIWIWPISKSAGLVVVAPMPSLGSIKLGDWRFVNQLGNKHMYTIEHYWTHTKDVCVSISYS